VILEITSSPFFRYESDASEHSEDTFFFRRKYFVFIEQGQL